MKARLRQYMSDLDLIPKVVGLITLILLFTSYLENYLSYTLMLYMMVVLSEGQT